MRFAHVSAGCWMVVLTLAAVADGFGDNQTQLPMIELAGHSGDVYGIAFSADSKLLASGGLDKTIRIWDVATGKPVAVLETPVRVVAVAFKPVSEALVVGYENGNVVAWHDWKTQTPKNEVLLNTRNGLCVGLKYAKDGSALAIAWHGKAVVINKDNAVQGEYVCVKGQIGFGAGVATMDLSNDGKTLALVNTKSVDVWDVPGKKKSAEIPIAYKSREGPVVRGLALSTDGTVVATWGQHELRLWNARTGAELGSILGKGTIPQAAFLGDKILIPYGNGVFEFWNGMSRELVSTAKIGPAERIALSPDGQKMAVVPPDKKGKDRDTIQLITLPK